MFCPKCGNQVVDNAQFCPNCGINLKQVQNQYEQSIQQQPVYNNQPQNYYQQPVDNKSKKNKFVLVPIIVIIVLVALIFGVSKIINRESLKPSNDQNNQQSQENNNTSNNNTPNNNGGDITGTVDPDTNLTYDKDGAFLMAIEDVFTIDSGTFVSGKIERGTIKLNDEVQIIGLNHEIITTTVMEIYMSEEQLDHAEIGDNVSILLNNVPKGKVERGQVLAKTNSIKAATKFDADVYFLTKKEGGRDTPFFNNYSTQFYFRTTHINGVITLQSDIEMVNPGDNVKMTVEMESNVAIEIGTEFSVREDGRTIGKGQVTKIY